MTRNGHEFTARDVGGRIAETRREKGLTQEQLAALAPFSKRSLQDYEAGISLPYRHLRDLSSLLGRPVEWFLHGNQQTVALEDRLDRLEEGLGQVLHAIEDLKVFLDHATRR